MSTQSLTTKILGPWNSLPYHLQAQTQDLPGSLPHSILKAECTWWHVWEKCQQRLDMQVEISMHVCMIPLIVQNKARGRRGEGWATGQGSGSVHAATRLYKSLWSSRTIKLNLAFLVIMKAYLSRQI